jgi:CO/xanthine dehydrogenase Mo-binding subunit
VREILGGGAEGEVEVDAGEAEEEIEEGMKRLDVDDEAGGVEESEEWTALKGAGISQGKSRREAVEGGRLMPRTSHGGYRSRTSSTTQHWYHPR